MAQSGHTASMPPERLDPRGPVMAITGQFKVKQLDRCPELSVA
jgi:hypothetical protein